jgi:hypothetical protein
LYLDLQSVVATHGLVFKIKYILILHITRLQNRTIQKIKKGPDDIIENFWRHTGIQLSGYINFEPKFE